MTHEKANILLKCLCDSMKLVHPIMPYISEEVVKLLNSFAQVSTDKESALVIADWPKVYNLKKQEKEVRLIEHLIERDIASSQDEERKNYED